MFIKLIIAFIHFQKIWMCYEYNSKFNIKIIFLVINTYTKLEVNVKGFMIDVPLVQ